MAQQADRVVVIGSGISGLTAAYRLRERAAGRPRPLEVVVLEARDRVGGAIWTDRIGGYMLEGGADSFITNKPQALDLCHELGLGGQLIGTDHKHRRSFVVRNGKLLPVPEGFVLMAPRQLLPLMASPILSWKGKLRVLMDLLIPRRTEESDESLAGFVRRRMGREALDRLVQPLVAGIYTANPNELSLRATLPQFPEMERRFGGLIRGAWGRKADGDKNASGARYGLFASLADGMDTLPRTLASTLPPGSLRLSTPARRIARADKGGPWRVELLDGSALDARAVVVAAESHGSARLLDGVDPELSLQLRSIPYASSAIVQLGYRRDQISHPLNGFGVVIPAIENRAILAVSFTSVKFPSRAPAGSVLFRVFIGGALQADLFEHDDEDLLALARREVESLLGVKGDPELACLARHSRAMPQYTLGHLDRVSKVRELVSRHPGLILAGNAFDGVGIPDCVRSGNLAAEAVLAALDAPPARAVA
jgi:oxygen-dependent protoporphyrinogen oxidase